MFCPQIYLKKVVTFFITFAVLGVRSHCPRLVLVCNEPVGSDQLSITSPYSSRKDKLFAVAHNSTILYCVDKCKELKADELSWFEGNTFFLCFDDTGCLVPNGTTFHCTSIFLGDINHVPLNSTNITYSENECSRPTRPPLDISTTTLTTPLATTDTDTSEAPTTNQTTEPTNNTQPTPKDDENRKKCVKCQRDVTWKNIAIAFIIISIALLLVILLFLAYKMELHRKLRQWICTCTVTKTTTNGYRPPSSNGSNQIKMN